MDSKDIDRAMRLRLPVIYDGTRYDRIQEFISWYDDNGKKAAILRDSPPKLHNESASG